MEKILFSIEFDDDDANKKLQDLVKSAVELKNERQALEKTFKEGNISMAQYSEALVKNAKETESNAKAQKALKRDMELADAGRKAAAGSVEQLKSRVAQLTSQYNSLSKEQRENSTEGKRLAATIKNLNAEIKEAAEATGKQGLAGAFKEAISENTSLGKSIQATGTAIKTNPIGLLVTALISLVGVLKESKPFMDFFEGVMSRINAVVDVAKDRFFTFASGLKEIFTGNFAKGAEILRQSVAGIGDEIAREVKLSGELSAARQKLERQQIDAVATSQKLIAEEERLKTIRDDETKSIPERLAANEKAWKLEEQRKTLLLGLSQKNLDILKQEAERRGGLDKLTTEQYQKLKEAEAELDQIREDSEGRFVEFLTNRNSLNKEAADLAAQLAKQRAEAEAAEEQKRISGSIATLEAHENNILDLKTKAEERLTQAAAKGIADRKKYNELELQEQERIAQEEIRIRQEKVNAIFSLENSLSDIAGAFVKNARAAAGIQKGLALTQIATNTAVAISELVKASNGNPLNLLSGGIAGVIQFTTGLAQILTNIAKAKQLLSNTPAFAHGGLVIGPGGPKDDRIPALLSNGEAVMTAKSVKMFGPQLSAMNQAGGGKAFGPDIKSQFSQRYADGGLVARTVSAPVMANQQYSQMYKMITAMPSPVVIVKDINDKQAQVARTISVSDH